MPRPKPILIDRPAGKRRTDGADLAALLNLGPKSAAWLAATGIGSREQIAALGAIGTCRRLRTAGFPVSVLLAYALEGALTGCHWNELPPETKQWLRGEFARMKAETMPGGGRRAPSRR